jgi:hypothetical protein
MEEKKRKINKTKQKKQKLDKEKKRKDNKIKYIIYTRFSSPTTAPKT